MTATEYVVLVNHNDEVVGQAEKIEAHQRHLLHRAFSVFVFRRVSGVVEVLLQQRAAHKYHSGGLWTNTCCSHPRPEESVVAAATRRLAEELAISADLNVLGRFHYEAYFGDGLSEHELDYVLTGEIGADVIPVLNLDEVQACQWMSIDAIREKIARHPDDFTAWFAEAFSIFCKE